MAHVKNALAIFAKVPIPGQVKTRLAPALGFEGATELYRCFLRDIIAKAIQVGDWEPIIFYAPADASQLLRDVIQESIERIPQSDGDLGCRMNNAFKELFARGYGSAIIIGADLPTLPLSHLNAACSALERKPIVLGPSFDGGYYLIGLRSAQSELFDDIAWSTNEVLGQTMDRINRIGLQVECLAPWYDIDTVDDLDFLCSHLKLLLIGGMSDLPCQTIEFLRRVGRLYSE